MRQTFSQIEARMPQVAARRSVSSNADFFSRNLTVLSLARIAPVHYVNFNFLMPG